MDDKTTTPAESTTPTQPTDPLTEGLVNILKPAISDIDMNVANTRESQLILHQQIDKLTEELQKLALLQKPPIDLDPYIKKLLNCRRKVTIVNSILQSTQERLNKLQQNIAREINRKKTLAEAPGV